MQENRGDREGLCLRHSDIRWAYHEFTIEQDNCTLFILFHLFLREQT